MEKFSNLGDGLAGVEAGLKGADPKRLREARKALVHEVEASRYRLGERLAAYKEQYRKSRLWMQAAQLVATALGVDERTVRNILKDYETASKLPEPILEAAENHNLDLAKARNRRHVEKIKESLIDGEDIDGPRAEEIVSNVMFMLPAKDEPEDDRFEPLTDEEKRRFAIRRQIRGSLVNIAPKQRLEALIAALEEEMYDEWGLTKPVTVTITPRKSGLTSDGRKRRVVAA